MQGKEHVTTELTAATYPVVSRMFSVKNKGAFRRGERSSCTARKFGVLYICLVWRTT